MNKLRIKKIISDVFDIDVDSINEQTSMNTVGAWDSLGHIDLLAELEQRLGIVIDVEDIERMTNFADILDALDGAINQSRIKQIMADVFRIEADSINEHTSMNTVGTWDSLGHINMITALEQEFGIMVDVEDIERMTSFTEIMETIAAKREAAHEDVGEACE